MGSISKEEKDRLKAIIADTVTLLCKNGLNAKFKREFTVEGLIGITLDKDDLMLVSIKECIENPAAPPPTSSSGDSDSSGDEQKVDGSSRKRKRKRKKRPADGETPSKTVKTNDDSDNEPDHEFNDQTDDNPDTPSATPSKRSLFSPQHPGSAANIDNSNLESNDSFFTLHDIKQDHSDDDLIEIIKEEPGLRSPGAHHHQGMPPHIISIQSIPGQGPPPLGSFSPAAINQPGMPSPSGQMPPGQMPPGLQMAPGQYEDLMQQVELIPGSGVYIKKATYNQLQFIDKGSKLVRKLVREIFPDVHLLASSSCMGKGETSAGLDRHKVEVIKDYMAANSELSMATTVHCINQICKEARYKVRNVAARESSMPRSGSQPENELQLTPLWLQTIPLFNTTLNPLSNVSPAVLNPLSDVSQVVLNPVLDVSPTTLNPVSNASQTTLNPVSNASQPDLDQMACETMVKYKL